MLILLYVDDILLCVRNDNPTLLSQVIRALQAQYQITNLGPVKQYLGIAVNQAKDSIQLGQSHFVPNLLHRFGLQYCNGHATSLEPGSCSRLNTTHLSDSEQKTYQSLVRAIMYLMLGTRPDLAYAISVLSKYPAKPQQHHIGMAKRVLRYFKQTQTEALTYRLQGGADTSLSPIKGLPDSNWAGDTSDRHSTSGYLFLYRQTAVS